MANTYEMPVEKDKIKNVKSLIKGIESSLDKLMYFDTLDNESQFEQLSTCVDKSIAISGLLKNMTDHVAAETTDSYCLDGEKSLTMTKEGNVYKFVLDDLLPQRRSIKNKQDTIKYGAFKTYISIGYKEGIEEYWQKHHIDLFHTKILVCFINYFNESDNKIDLDNLDQKPFIDICVSRYLVADDSPEYISHLMIGEKTTEKSHTEVYVGTKQDVLNKLEELSINF